MKNKTKSVQNRAESTHERRHRMQPLLFEMQQHAHQLASEALQVLKDAGLIHDFMGTPFRTFLDFGRSCTYVVGSDDPSGFVIACHIGRRLAYKTDRDQWNVRSVDDVYQSILQERWKQHVSSVADVSTPLGAEHGLGWLVAEFSMAQRRPHVPF